MHGALRGLPVLAAQGAVAEAGFMTGMERNSEVVQLAAYAPLLANVAHTGALCPTNLVIYDNHRWGPLQSPIAQPPANISAIALLPS
jgi:hypothetical protein